MEQHTIYNLSSRTVHICGGKSIIDAIENLVSVELGIDKKLVKVHKKRNEAEAFDDAAKNNGIVYMSHSKAGVKLYYLFINDRYIHELNIFTDFLNQLSEYVDSIQQLGCMYKVVTHLDEKKTVFANITLHKTPAGLVATLDIQNRTGNRKYYKYKASDIEGIRQALLLGDIIKY